MSHRLRTETRNGNKSVSQFQGLDNPEPGINCQFQALGNLRPGISSDRDG